MKITRNEKVTLITIVAIIITLMFTLLMNIQLNEYNERFEKELRELNNIQYEYKGIMFDSIAERFSYAIYDYNTGIVDICMNTYNISNELNQCLKNNLYNPLKSEVYE